MSVLTAYHGNSHGNVKDDLKFQISAESETHLEMQSRQNGQQVCNTIEPPTSLEVIGIEHVTHNESGLA